jgi:hypothetical protein
MMFSSAVRNSVIVISLTVALVAATAAFAVAPALAQSTDPVQICTDNGGVWENDSCSGLGTGIVCQVFEDLNLPLPEDCEGSTEEPVDSCPTVPGIQSEEDPCPSQAELDCTNGGGTWNSETETCTPADNGGGDDEGGGDTGGGSENTDNAPHGGGSIGGGGGSGGQVLGASTDEVCSTPLITSYLGEGKQNDFAEVVKLQLFLNTQLGLTVPVTGIFGSETKAAAEQFQIKYASEVLAPWVPFGLASATTPTGYVYKTTKRMINKIHCASLDIPMPQLP